MSDEKIYGVDGMTRQQFERDLRSRYQHDNVRRKECGIRIDLEWDEKDIQERVTLNYGKANCPGCGAFDVGMSEVTFDRECIGCQARMRAANGLGPTPKPEYVVRFEHLSGLPPTQGADARPVASAKQRYDELNAGEGEPDPVERLRAFCSLAMTGQDWIDVEPFFDAIISQQNCACAKCKPITLANMRMIVCATCGNKRCPHATDHRNACTSSNEPGQPGSSYAAIAPMEKT